MSKKIKKTRKATPKRNLHHISELLSEAITLHKGNQLDKAEELYRKILAISPQHPLCLNFLGLVLQQQGKFEPALKCALRAVRVKKDSGFYSNLGSAYRGCGNLLKAVESYKKALNIDPDLTEAQFNLACTLQDIGDHQKAETIFKKIILLKPRMLEAYEGLRQSLYLQGNFAGAIQCSDKILQLTPDDSNAMINKAIALEDMNKSDKALAIYESALANSPNNPLLLNNIGNILSKKGNIHESLNYYEKAVKIKPDFIAAGTNLAWTYLQHGLLTESISSYKSLLFYHPHSLEIYSDLLFTLNYDPTLKPKQLYEASCLWWNRYQEKHPEDLVPPLKSVTINKSIPTQPLQQKTNSLPPRLKIGFISPDLKKHPVGTFLSPLLQQLHNGDMEIFAYAELHPASYDEVTRNLKSNTDHWYVTHEKNDHTVVQQIVSDKIDILIDLAGHSANNRLSVLAKKPARIQLNWLGYVNTSGLPTIGYRLTDAETDPPGSEEFYSEKLVRLPNGFFCYSPPATAPKVNTLPARKNAYVTFGSFNNLVKISENVIQTWAEVLLKTPESRLIMVSKPLSDEFIRSTFKKLFNQFGVDEKRLEMHGHLPTEEYLAMHNKIDIALDTFPHNGHTITCHSLWMGVPVITLQGDRYASRMGTSIMTRIGLPELIAANKSDYIKRATALAADLDHLSSLRFGMRERMLASPMCNPKQFCHDFIHALKHICSATKQDPDPL